MTIFILLVIVFILWEIYSGQEKERNARINRELDEELDQRDPSGN
jgi:cbb3-type cytochrome oxidase subunit 3